MVPLSLTNVENAHPLKLSVTGEPVADYVVTGSARGGAIIRTACRFTPTNGSLKGLLGFFSRHSISNITYILTYFVYFVKR